MANNDCKWMREEFCTNADCPIVADYCPVADMPGVCRYEDRKEDKSMEKPLKDWTLGEVMERCKQQGDVCAGCEFYSMDGCEFAIGEPTEWELIRHRFTPEEVERLRAIVQIDPSVDSLRTDSSFAWGQKNGGAVIRVRRKLFHSMRDYETVKISDIIGGAHE